MVEFQVSNKPTTTAQSLEHQTHPDSIVRKNLCIFYAKLTTAAQKLHS